MVNKIWWNDMQRNNVDQRKMVTNISFNENSNVLVHACDTSEEYVHRKRRRTKSAYRLNISERRYFQFNVLRNRWAVVIIHSCAHNKNKNKKTDRLSSRALSMSSMRCIRYKVWFDLIINNQKVEDVQRILLYTIL